MATTPNDLCDFWHFEEGTRADEKFDAGEFSRSHRRLNPYTRCGTCSYCRGEAQYHADNPDPPWLVEQPEPGAYGGSPDAPAPHTDRAEPAWVAMAHALHRELQAARVPYSTHASQAGNWTRVLLPNSQQVEIWYADHQTREAQYVLLVWPRTSDAADVFDVSVHVASFQPAYASTVAQLIALFVRAGGVV